MQVAGAGCVEVNGVYSSETDTEWTHGEFRLCRFRSEWIIKHKAEPSARYAVTSVDTHPPAMGWRVCRRGTAPAPCIARRAAVSVSVVGNGVVKDKGAEIDHADDVVRFNHGIFHPPSAAPDVGDKTTTWVFSDLSWRTYRQRAIPFVNANPDVKLVCYNPHHPQHTAALRKDCPRPFELLTLDEIRCASCRRFRTWHPSHCCSGCERGTGHDAACLARPPTTGLRYLIDKGRDACVRTYGFDAFKSGHYGTLFPLKAASLSFHDAPSEARIMGLLAQPLEKPRTIYAGIYSDKYSAEYQSLRAQLIARGVKGHEVLFKRVPQDTFRPRPNCYWCGGKSCSFAFHHGEACKIEYQLELYKRYLDRDVLIVFLDADVGVHAECLPDWRAVLDGWDIAFEREGAHPTARWTSNINIGFTLTRATSGIIKLFEDVQRTLRERAPPLNWDQQVVNHAVKRQSALRVKLLARGGGTGFSHKRSGGGTKSRLETAATVRDRALKRVAVVGPREILVCGSEIESADRVVRVGEKPERDARHVGNRTDLRVDTIDGALHHFEGTPISVALFGVEEGMMARYLRDVRVYAGRSVLRIPIAEDCFSTRALRAMRCAATPFDWIVASPSTVLQLLRSDFDGFLDDVVLHKRRTRPGFVRHMWDGAETVKDTVEFWDRRNRVLVPHHMSDISQLPGLRTKMRERIDRMYADMQAADAIELWYKPTSDEELAGLPDGTDFGESAMRRVECDLVRFICERFEKRSSDVRLCYL